MNSRRAIELCYFTDFEWPQVPQTFCITLHIFSTDGRRDFKCGRWVDRDKIFPNRCVATSHDTF